MIKVCFILSFIPIALLLMPTYVLEDNPKKSRILLVGNVFSEGSTSLLVWKGLQELGHDIKVWDTNITPKTPDGNFDISIVWTNNVPDINLLKGEKVFFYIDDTTFWEQNNKNLTVDNVTRGYDHVYTLHEIPNYESCHFGYDPDIHKKLYGFSNHHALDIAFIGTCRDTGRWDTIRTFNNSLPKKYAFKVWGNNWTLKHNSKVSFVLPCWQGIPVYFMDFTCIINSCKISIAQHFNSGPSTKDFEIPAIGNALMISDNVEAVSKIYPNMPVYHSVEELVGLVEYYLENESERLKIVNEMKKLCKPYSYKDQLKKIIEKI